MVDRGELEAWKTPGGHRRISRASLQAWLARRAGGVRAAAEAGAQPEATGRAPTPAVPGPTAVASPLHVPRVLLIEDSAHFQNLIRLIMRQALPEAELHVADDGIAGLAMAERLDPDILIVDILLPGIDGATLITSLRSHPQFRRMALLVVTSLDTAQREPYAFALQGLPVVHKSRLVAELPPLLQAHGKPAMEPTPD
jgi:CheY-like chemotaxis protein